MFDSSTPQLSSRMLRSTLLWVIVLIASVVYTLFLSWRLEAGFESVRQVRILQHEVFQVGYTLSSPQKSGINFDIQGFVWRVDSGIASSAVQDDTFYRVMARDERINEALAKLNTIWREELKPTLLRWNTQRSIASGERRKFLEDLNTFNHYINAWLAYIDADANRNIVVLRYTQVALGLASILSVIIAMWFMVVSVLRPLNQLQEGINRLRTSDWKTRVDAHGSFEFEHISSGFNDLASHLDDVYTNLENKVEEKTSSLAEKNSHLTTLYGLTAFLGEQHSVNELCESFLARVLTLSGGVSGEVRFWDEDTGRASLVCQNAMPDDYVAPNDEHAQAFWVEMLDTPKPKTVPIADYPLTTPTFPKGIQGVKVCHIRHKQKNIGLVILFFREMPEDKPAIDTLLENLGQHVGSAIENMRLTALDRQIAVGQERNLMAQNLHDSIAQTLSFLNLQVQMLEGAVKQKDEAQIAEGIGLIRAGVQECYDDVRELLLNFRTRVSKEDFIELVQSVLERFERQTHVKARLSVTGDGMALTYAQKLQAIFILQEALSNVRKHAQAKNVLVNVRNRDDFEMMIMDDGVGIDEELLEKKKERHVGLSIMRERAQKVNGHISIESEQGSGTTIKFLLTKDERKPL